jgi:hypothetical protein
MQPLYELLMTRYSLFDIKFLGLGIRTGFGPWRRAELSGTAESIVLFLNGELRFVLFSLLMLMIG